MKADFFDQLEAELRAAVPRAAADGRAQARGRRWRGLRPGGLALALSAAVTVAVVLLAVVALGHHPASQTRPALRHHFKPIPAGDSPQFPLGAVPTRAQLLANFAVLRRPQNARDRTWRPRCDCAGSARQFYGLTRFATRLPSGYRVYLDVEQFTVGGQLNMAAGSYVMNVDVVDAHGNVSSGAFGPNTGFTVFPLSSGGDNAVWTSMVPDGVSAVRWRFDCAGDGRVPCSAPPRTLTVPVTDNIAARQVANAGNCDGCAGPTHIVWLGPDGRVVASFARATNLPAAPFVIGSRSGQTRAVLHPDAVGDVRLGTPAHAALGALTRLLGAPADTDVAAGSCGIDHESVWASPTTASPLTVFMRGGRLVGYQYGAPTSEIGLLRGPGAVLTTARGVTVAQRIAALRRRYGSALATTPAHGGRWSARGDGGVLGGAVQPISYPLRRVAAANPVATIDAGDIGCPIAGR